MLYTAALDRNCVLGIIPYIPVHRKVPATAALPDADQRCGARWRGKEAQRSGAISCNAATINGIAAPGGYAGERGRRWSAKQLNARIARLVRRTGRDAHAPGAHSRHAGATPVHMAHIARLVCHAGGDARAPGTHSRHAGGDARAPGTHIRTESVMRAGTPAHLARTFAPNPSCGRDARAPGTYRASHSSCGRGRPRTRRPQPSCGRGRPRSRRAHSHRSRHAGGTPAHPAPAAVMRARRPRTWHAHRAPHASTEMNFGLHSAEAGTSCDTANPECVHWTGSRGGAEARETCQFESS